MKVVTIHAAKTQLSKLLAEVEAGEEIVLARGKTPVARLTRYAPPAGRRQAGSLRGQIALDESFFDPLPEAELKAWE